MTLTGRVNPFADMHLERKQSSLFIVQFRQSLDNTYRIKIFYFKNNNKLD